MSLPSILSSFYVSVFVLPTFVCFFFISAENNLCFYASASVMCHQSCGNCQYGRRATKQRSRSDCHSYFSFPSRLPHTSSSIILLRALVPNVKRTQLQAQQSVLRRPMKIHVHYTTSMNKCRDDCKFISSMLGLTNPFFFFREVRDAFRCRTFVFPVSA
jgi:hypothetical protein